MKKVSVQFPNGKTGTILESEFKSRKKKGHKIALFSKKEKEADGKEAK
jgi:hypothetical protein